MARAEGRTYGITSRFYLMFCPQWTTPPPESAFSIPTFTYNVCPSSDNEIRDEIKDRKRGFRDGRCTLRNRNRKLSAEEIECVHSIRTPSAAHSVPLDGIEKFVGPLAAPRENSTAE
jgi:hypothetical protein